MAKKIIVGLLSGIICGLFSTGGGLLLIPAFTILFKFSEKEARANSILCILPMVIVSSIIYQFSTNIDFKIIILSCVGEVVGAIIGSKLLNKLEPKYLKLIYIFFLIYAGLKNLF